MSLDRPRGLSGPLDLFDGPVARDLLIANPAGELMRAIDKVLPPPPAPMELVSPGGMRLTVQPNALVPLNAAWWFDHDGQLRKLVFEPKDGA